MGNNTRSDASVKGKMAGLFWGQMIGVNPSERIAALAFTAVFIAALSFCQLAFFPAFEVGGDPVYVILMIAPLMMGAIMFGPLAATLFGNEEALEMYGSVVDADLSEIAQVLLFKFINGDSLQLYRNEVYGFDALDWEPFPKALVVSDDVCRCDTIDGSLTEIEALKGFMLH